MITVKDFLSEVSKVTPSYTPYTLGDLEYVTSISSDGLGTDGLRDKNSGAVYGFSEETFDGFARYIEIPTKFADRLPLYLRKQVIDHFMDKNKSKPSTVTHFKDEFQNIFKQNQLLLPPDAVMDRVAKVFGDDDIISHVDFRDGLLLNVHTSSLQESVRVGDVTNGGIRFNAVHGATPKVSAYMERLVCRNGMIATTEVDSIPLRGYTLGEVLNSMENIAQHYMDKVLPGYLKNCLHQNF